MNDAVCRELPEIKNGCKFFHTMFRQISRRQIFEDREDYEKSDVSPKGVRI